uniref:Uncharacterized protein n=1 Tax=Gadus morhua TaxID=8049 RepID=A0A8C5F9T2_GADMO
CTLFSVVCLSGSDRSPLHDAAFQGRPLSLRTLLTQGFPADLRSLDGVTALHEACLAGHAPCTRLLLEHGATVTSSDGATPLLNACRRGSAACVRLLLGRGPAVPTNQLLAGAVHEAQKPSVWLTVSWDVSAPLDPDAPGSLLNTSTPSPIRSSLIGLENQSRLSITNA